MYFSEEVYWNRILIYMHLFLQNVLLDRFMDDNDVYNITKFVNFWTK
jgi:hypothetical protein